jgi:acyl-coenzyme A synthetase/AMP-(fatty) acid ligase/thioesterase domain-containing protein
VQTAPPDELIDDGWLEADPRPLDWNGPSGRPFTRFPEEDLGRPIIELFERVARRNPYRTAVRGEETSVSYAELWDGACGLAESIAGRTRPGELVALMLPASPAFALAVLACLAAGRPFLPLDANAPGEWLDQALSEVRPGLVIRPEHVAAAPAAATAGWSPTPAGPDAPACVLFTSGSTGRPKGVVNGQRALLQRVAQAVNAAHINAEDRLLTLAPPATIVGVRDVLTALVSGASVRLADPGLVGARQMLEFLRRDQASILFAFPALLRSILAQARGRTPGALRLVRIGGDVTLWSDIDRLRAWLGPEAGVQIVYAATEAPIMQWFVDDAVRGEEARVPVGYPLADNRLAILDEAGRPAERGEAGELVVASPYVSLGLWRGGRFLADEARLFRTGDLVRLRPDGLLERLGRKDRQVKIRGVRVELEGVEAILRQHACVRDAAALARTEADGQASLVAYVAPRDGAPAALPAELKALLGASPPQMRPGRIYLVRELPRLASSKLDVRALTALDEANRQGESVAAAAPDPQDGDAVAMTVAQVWRDVLGRPIAGPGDDFFECGGDSLKAIVFMTALEQALGSPLPLTLIGEAPTVGALCEALRGGVRRYAPLVLLKPGDGAAPVFFVHGVSGTVSDLYPLARAMDWPGPVIGVQARGLAGRERPRLSIEAMAGEYLAAVRARQGEGPYHLCGYSLGGLIALEMAQRLRAAGEEIGLLGMLDTAQSLLRLPPWLWPAAGRNLGAPSLIGGLRTTPVRILRLMASGLIASARYRPRYYAGEITLFAPQDRDPALPSLETVWRGRAAALTVIPVPGGHLSMLAQPNAAALAEAVMTRLQIP